MFSSAKFDCGCATPLVGSAVSGWMDCLASPLIAAGRTEPTPQRVRARAGVVGMEDSGTDRREGDCIGSKVSEIRVEKAVAGGVNRGSSRLRLSWLRPLNRPDFGLGADDALRAPISRQTGRRQLRPAGALFQVKDLDVSRNRR